MGIINDGDDYSGVWRGDYSSRWMLGSIVYVDWVYRTVETTQRVIYTVL